MSDSNQVNRLTGRIPTPAATAGTDATLEVPVVADGKSKAISAYFVPAADITANDTNYATLDLKVGSTSLGTLVTTTGGTGDLTAGEATAFTLSGAGSNLVAQGGEFTVAVTKSGTGVAVTGDVIIGARRVRAD